MVLGNHCQNRGYAVSCEQALKELKARWANAVLSQEHISAVDRPIPCGETFFIDAEERSLADTLPQRRPVSAQRLDFVDVC